MNVKDIYHIYQQTIEDYHKKDHIDQKMVNPYKKGSLEAMFYEKCWIDNVQWHCEDEVRSPVMDAEGVKTLKNKIDKLNQSRTNKVEEIDDYYFESFKKVKVNPNPRINTESPAWALDRLSILALKIYHMNIEANNEVHNAAKQKEIEQKFQLLTKQKNDLIHSIHRLFVEVKKGETTYNIYRQMKMYNDEELNPILRSRL